ncbi:hypothetical protein SAMN04487857_10412 [Pseudomonas sp. ok272]|uniref:hypothetical protein n=1 Tax=unclassified Pseudomonas TaxID=196821 RepID=UPI0008D20633|nr:MULTISPECIES: hypothetical protein [unclassified Pseudomonas]SEM67857.1 hypothetical protein SAMN04487857_10412 [Pseudomonas sp. ok272]SFM56760.1 hypothetical protein SAMN04487858_10412 [Pseudomonas sp. ok602]
MSLLKNNLFSKKAAVLLLTALTAFSTVNVNAASQPATKTAPAQKVSVLGGKFSFALPAGFVANTLPGGDAANGTSGATGTMYVNPQSKTVLIIAENTLPDGQKVKDNDPAFLDTSLSGFVTQQRAALPDFNKQSEKSLTVKGLGLRQIDSTATQGGGPTLNTSLLAGSGSRMMLIQVISRIEDSKGHAALLKQILGQ